MHVRIVMEKLETKGCIKELALEVKKLLKKRLPFAWKMW